MVNITLLSGTYHHYKVRLLEDPQSTNKGNDMENEFVKINNKTLAVIFTVMFITTLCGIIFKGAWWHCYTLVVTGILAIVFWMEKDDDKSDNSPIQKK